jgi:hypothetical protein
MGTFIFCVETVTKNMMGGTRYVPYELKEYSKRPNIVSSKYSFFFSIELLYTTVGAAGTLGFNSIETGRFLYQHPPSHFPDNVIMVSNLNSCLGVKKLAHI